MKKQLHQFGLKSGLILLLLSSFSCAPRDPATTESPGPGVLTVDAEISGGTRFVVYTNDVWSAPQREALAAGKRKLYRFALPVPLKTLRFDPSEAPDAHATIFSVEINLPGMPKKVLPLTDLPKFLSYHCRLAMNGEAVTVDAGGPDMYFMSTVDPASYPPAS